MMTSIQSLFLLVLIIPTFLFAKASASVTGGGVIIFDGIASEGGLNLEYLQLFNLSQKVALGAKIGLNRWNTVTVHTTSGSEGFSQTKEKDSNYILEFAPAFRFYAQTSDYTRFFLEPTAGYDLFIYTGTEIIEDKDFPFFPKYEEKKMTNGAFGFSMAAGFDFKKFEVKPSYKMYIKDGEAMKLVSFAMGLAF